MTVDVEYFDEQDIYGLNWIKAGIDDVPAKPGVYMLTNRHNGELEYVGSAARLKYRIANKMHPVYSNDLHTIKYIEIDDVELRHYTEAKTIAILRPSMNKRAGLYVHMSDRILDLGYAEIFNGL